MIEAELAQRLRAGDVTLWPAGSEAPTRLGWLDVHERVQAETADLRRWASHVEADRIVLIGMGGSSLGPEVLRAAHRSDRLVVLDTTDPATVARVPVEGSFFVVSSKSGTTLEPRAVTAHFWERVPDGSRWAAVTDPGTALAAEATEKGFSRIFENDPNIGGRYSVLSWFGLVPAALMGMDPVLLCQRATASTALAFREGVRMGCIWADAHAAGRDKLTIHVPKGPIAAFGLWAEQLVAESLGKNGIGVVPVPTTDVETGADREIVAVHVGDPYDLPEQFLVWEVATAIAGSLMGIDPFDQPDVESAKVATRSALESLPLPEGVPDGVDVLDGGGLLPWLEGRVSAGDYVSVQAYLPYGANDTLERVRTTIRDHLGGMAVTAGYGPRFLHSTGQLHKGGPKSVVAVQIVPRRPTADLEVPGFGFDFGTLIAAQALGDLEALASKDRRVVRVVVDRDASEAIDGRGAR